MSNHDITSKYIANLRTLYSHLAKRVFDEFGIEIDDAWEARVLSGEHDVPLSRPASDEVTGCADGFGRNACEPQGRG